MYFRISPGSPSCSRRLLVSTSDSSIIDQMIWLYLKKFLSTSPDQSSLLYFLFHVPWYSEYPVHLPYGTGKKKYYAIDRMYIYTRKKINLDLGDEFNARKWFPALRALSLSTLYRSHLNHNFQFSKMSVMKLLRVRHAERPWEGNSPAGTVIFLQGNYMRVRRGGWTTPPLPLTPWENEAPCRIHSTLDQSRNHSPV